MYFKKAHSDVSYSTCDFLKKKIKKRISDGSYIVPNKTSVRGISSEKREHILKKLGCLMPASRRMFFENLVASDAADMLVEL